MFKVLSIFAVLTGLALVPTGTARAEMPDFSICDGLTGASRGLCRAGVAAGCADGTGNPTACAEIEERYMMVSGGDDAPWILPPCPCDYSVVPATVAEWTGSLGFSEISYTCPPVPPQFNSFRAIFEPVDGSGAVILPFLFVLEDFGVGADEGACGARSRSGSESRDGSISNEEVHSCYLDIIDYATEFMSANPGVPVDDQCTPIL